MICDGCEYQLKANDGLNRCMVKHTVGQPVESCEIFMPEGSVVLDLKKIKCATCAKALSTIEFRRNDRLFHFERQCKIDGGDEFAAAPVFCPEYEFKPEEDEAAE